MPHDVFIFGLHMYRIASLIGFVLLCSCSSTHDLKRDGINVLGGGFLDDQIGDGFYLVKGFSNTAMFATKDSAASTFEYRAKQLCPDGYAEVRAVTNAYKPALPGEKPVPQLFAIFEAPRNVITSKIGYILCSNSPVTLEEAKAIVKSRTE